MADLSPELIDLIGWVFVPFVLLVIGTAGLFITILGARQQQYQSLNLALVLGAFAISMVCIILGLALGLFAWGKPL